MARFAKAVSAAACLLYYSTDNLAHASSNLTGATVDLYQVQIARDAETWGPFTVPFAISDTNDGSVLVYESGSQITISSPHVYEIGSSEYNIFIGYVFDFTGNHAQITNVYIDPATTLAGFTQSDVSWTANSISVNFFNHDVFKYNEVVLNIQTAVPEPSTWALMVFGAGAVFAVGKFRNRQRNEPQAV